MVTAPTRIGIVLRQQWCHQINSNCIPCARQKSDYLTFCFEEGQGL